MLKCLSKILIRDSFGRCNSIDPTKVKFDAFVQKPVKVRKLRKLQACLSGKRLDEYKLNGEKIFEKLDDRGRGRVERVFGGAAKNRKEVIETAETIGTDMQIKDANRFLSTIEILSAEVKGLEEYETRKKLEYLQGEGKLQLIEQISRDLIIATDVAKSAELNFIDPVYHIQKHKGDFVKDFKSFTTKDYLINLPKMIIQDCHLTEVCIIQIEKEKDEKLIGETSDREITHDEKYEVVAVKKIYVTPDDYLGVTIGTHAKEIISTLYVKKGSWKSNHEKLQQIHHDSFLLCYLPLSSKLTS